MQHPFISVAKEQCSLPASLEVQALPLFYKPVHVAPQGPWPLTQHQGHVIL